MKNTVVFVYNERMRNYVSVFSSLHRVLLIFYINIFIVNLIVRSIYNYVFELVLNACCWCWMLVYWYTTNNSSYYSTILDACILTLNFKLCIHLLNDKLIEFARWQSVQKERRTSEKCSDSC